MTPHTKRPVDAVCLQRKRQQVWPNWRPRKAYDGSTLGDLVGLLRCLSGLARIAGLAGDRGAVARILGRIQALASRTGVSAVFDADLTALIEATRVELGRDFDRYLEQGASDELEAVVQISIN